MLLSSSCREVLSAGNVLKGCQLKEINRTEKINRIEIPIISLGGRFVGGSISRLLEVVKLGISLFKWM